jgi:hypothetical protein
MFASSFGMFWQCGPQCTTAFPTGLAEHAELSRRPLLPQRPHTHLLQQLPGLSPLAAVDSCIVHHGIQLTLLLHLPNLKWDLWVVSGFWGMWIWCVSVVVCPFLVERCKLGILSESRTSAGDWTSISQCPGEVAMTALQLSAAIWRLELAIPGGCCVISIISHTDIETWADAVYSVIVSPLCPLGILQNNPIQEGIDNVTSVVVNIILWTSLNYSMQVILLANWVWLKMGKLKTCNLSDDKNSRPCDFWVNLVVGQTWTNPITSNNI